MKSSKIMRRAARIAEEEIEGACYGIQEAFGWYIMKDHKWEIKEAFAQYFRPLDKNKSDYWFGLPYYDDNLWTANPETQNHRVIAMLLMAEIFESMGD